MTTDAERDALYRYRQALDAERAQWLAEIANLRGLIAGRHDWETVPVGDIRKALRIGPAPDTGPMQP